MRCIGPNHARWSLLFILAAGRAVSGSLVNRTIDDVYGDSVTGALVQYLPEVPASDGLLWFNQTSCAGCADVPDANSALDQTWTAALYLADISSMSLSMDFSGNAIFVFFIVPNFATDSKLASSVRCSFFIDGAQAGSFTHDSDGSSQFAYNTLVYSNVTVPNGDHVLLIETTGADPATIIFDYALYTVENDMPQEIISAPAASSMGSSPTTVSSPPMLTPDDPTTTNSDPWSPSAQPADNTPVIPSAPVAPTSSALVGSAPPFLVPPISNTNPAFPITTTTTPFSPATAPTMTETTETQRSTPVVAILAGVAGGAILVVLVSLFIVLYRRRRRRLAEMAGTISIFELLDDNPPPPPTSIQGRRRPRPLPSPPMSESHGGRSIDATPTKMQAPFAGPSGFHSAQSSVSGYTDSRSDLHIHIPMAALQPSDLSHSPMTHTPSHSHSYSHAHSPITRNGVPMPPEQADIVREILLGLAVDSRSASSVHRSGAYTPTTETGRASVEDDDIWDEPVIHVDSGIRISRAIMELPPVYAAA